MKGGFTIEGLPDGLDFRKPYHYGSKQIQRIMMVAEGITFEILEEAEQMSGISTENDSISTGTRCC